MFGKGDLKQERKLKKQDKKHFRIRKEKKTEIIK